MIWLLPPGAQAVLDLAAGTGAVTRELVGLDGQLWDQPDLPLICRCLRSRRLAGQLTRAAVRGR